jgi:hypothetical protein
METPMSRVGLYTIIHSHLYHPLARIQEAHPLTLIQEASRLGLGKEAPN